MALSNIDQQWMEVNERLLNTSKTEEECKKSENKSIAHRQHGNTKYTERSYNDALLAYNNAIEYAPSDSVCLSQAYGNRAAVFMDISKYDECIRDCERSLSLLPDNDTQRRDKLTRRMSNARVESSKKEECHAAEQEHMFNGQNITLPVISASLTMKTNSISGRGLYAKTKIAQGAIISRELPFANAPKYSSNQDVNIGTLICNHCCIPLPLDWLPCNTCANSGVRYCSHECRFVCGSVANIVGVLDRQACKFLVALHILCKASQEHNLCNFIAQPANLLYDRLPKNPNETVFGDNLASIISLTGGNDEIAKSISANNAIKTILNKYLSTEFWSQSSWANEESATKLEECAKLITCIMDRLTCNVYAIALLLNRDNEDYTQIREYQKTNGGIAGALYITQSLFNHSCVPNCEIFYERNCSIIRVLNNIKAGDELTVSYGPRLIDLPKDERNNFLQPYAFQCACVGCTKMQDIEASLYTDYQCTHCKCRAVEQFIETKNIKQHKTKAKILKQIERISLDDNSIQVVCTKCSAIQQYSSKTVSSTFNSFEIILTSDPSLLSHFIPTAKALLTSLSQQLPPSNKRLNNIITRYARAIDNTDPEFSLKLFNVVLQSLSTIKSHFPLDYERHLCEQIWVTMKLTHRHPTLFKEGNRTILLALMKQLYELSTQLYGCYTQTVYDSRFGTCNYLTSLKTIAQN